MGYPTDDQFEEARRDRRPPASRRKNPENKHLRIVRDTLAANKTRRHDPSYPLVLAQLAVAQASLAKHKDSAMPHFIALVKEIENWYGIKFEIVDL